MDITKSKEEYLPSEGEWKIMEQLWKSDTPLTTIEIQKGIEKTGSMTLRTVRVLTNRLLKKGLVGFEVDKKDARVYHYHPLKEKGECEKAKSRNFVDSYFAGSQTSAVAALLTTCTLTEEQIKELEEILEQSKKGAPFSEKETDGEKPCGN